MYKMLAVVLASTLLVVQGSHFKDDEPCNNSLLIALSEFREIIRWDLEAEVVTAFTPTTVLQNAVAIAADQSAGVVFFTDVDLKIIMRKDFKKERDSYVIRRLSSASVPDGIAVDPQTQKVYYTDFGEKLIARMDYDGSNHQTLMTSLDNLDLPRAIVLDSQSRTMYYTDWGSAPHISKADFTGNNIVILQNRDLLFPNGLTADFTNNKIYWCDAGLDTISVMDTDGSGRQTLYSREAANLDWHFFDILLYHDVLLITDWRNKSVLALHKSGGTHLTTFLSAHEGRPNGLAAVCVAPTLSPQRRVTSLLDTTTAPKPTPTTRTPTPPSNESKEEQLSQTTIIIIAMAIGGTLLLTVILTIAVCCCLRITRNNSRSSTRHLERAGQDGSPPPPYPANPNNAGTRYETARPANKGGFDNPNVVLDNGVYLHPITRQTASRANTNENIYMSIVVRD